MALRRYLEYYIPIVHLNGKLAPAGYKCSPQAASDTNGVSFTYGYRHRSQEKSLFAVRSRCRNLSIKPFNAREEECMSAFGDTSAEVQLAWENGQRRNAAMLAAFRAQKKYKRVYNFAWAMTYANNRVFPWWD